jgi:hypothetical protein
MLQPKYPQKELLPKFENHLTLPNSDYVYLAKLVDNLNYGDTLFFYIYQRKWLVIITADENDPLDAKSYSVGQFEAPIEFLSWFSKALDDFISPSSQDGFWCYDESRSGCGRGDDVYSKSDGCRE